jgi:hypothetical protein
VRRIHYRFKRNRGCWGKAYPKQRRIELDPSLEDKTLLDIAIHEGLHVLFPIIDEDEINTAGTTLADLLWRMGFRRQNENE